jgi:hypothetical protein
VISHPFTFNIYLPSPPHLIVTPFLFGFEKNGEGKFTQKMLLFEFLMGF